MDPTAIRKKLGSRLNIPSLPEVVSKLNHMVEDPAMGMREIASQIAQDPPLAAKTMRVANSAYYALQVPVTSLEHAASILGTRTLKNMVMQAVILDLFEDLDSDSGFDPLVLWDHAVLTAHACTSFDLSILRKYPSDELFLCGLLHDIGEFVMYDHLGREFTDLRTQALALPGGSAELEVVKLGFNHAQIGSMVARRWGLPRNVVLAVNHHHDLKGEARTNPLVALVAIADMIVRWVSLPDWHPRQLENLPEKLLELLHLDLTEAEVVAQEIHSLAQATRS